MPSSIRRRRIQYRPSDSITVSTASGLSVTYQGVTRSLPQNQIDALPSGNLPWLRGVMGFAPWPAGIKVDVRYNGGVKEYSARLEASAVASGFYDGVSLHQSGSPWTQKIPDSPSLSAYFDGSLVAQGAEAQALDYLRFCLNRGTNNGVYAAHRNWSIPVYFADENTPVQSVTTVQFQTTDKKRFNSLPVPVGAIPDPQGDGHYCVVMMRSDNGTGHGEEYNGYNLTMTAGTFVNTNNFLGIDSVRRGYITKGSSFGAANGSIGPRANSTSTLGGLIWPHELAMGRIEHAMAISHPKQRAHYYPPDSGGAIKSPANAAVTTPSSPAGKDTRAGLPGTLDGRSITNDPEGLAGGQRIQLDPSIDIDAAATTFGWPAYQKVMAKAAQEYGLIMVDGGGYSTERIGMYLMGSHGYNVDPFNLISSDLAGTGSIGLRWADDLRDSFRLLDMGTQQPRSYGNSYGYPTDGTNLSHYAPV